MDTTLLLVLIGAASGIFSGFLAGLLGIGGGVILVPLLYFSFRLLFPSLEESMKFAVATALATAVVASLVSSLIHKKGESILPAYLKFLIPTLLLGSISGAFLAARLPDELLRQLFGCLAIGIGIYFLFPKLKLELGTKPNFLLSFSGLIIGHLSSLLGSGGGIFTLPILFGYPISAKNAVATSSVATFFTSLTGTILYLVLPSGDATLAHSIGWINLPAFFSISIASLFSVKFGSKLATTLQIDVIKRIFGVFLILTGVEFLI